MSKKKFNKISSNPKLNEKITKKKITVSFLAETQISKCQTKYISFQIELNGKELAAGSAKQWNIKMIV